MKAVSARVSAIKSDDASALEPFIEVGLGPVIGRLGDRCMEDDTPHTGARREIACLDILVVDAGISNVGKSEGDDLAGIRRIGEDFLITRHRRVETDFAHGGAGGAEPKPFEHHAVCQNEKRGRAGFAPESGSLLLLVRHAHSKSLLAFR
jgi:hypothetical protein